jgi:hypothetical protein
VPLASRDYLTLRDILEGWKAAPDVRYLAVTDNQGQVLASVDWNKQIPLPPPSAVDGERDIIHVAFPIEYQGVRREAVAAPALPLPAPSVATGDPPPMGGKPGIRDFGYLPRTSPRACPERRPEADTRDEWRRENR